MSGLRLGRAGVRFVHSYPTARVSYQTTNNLVLRTTAAPQAQSTASIYTTVRNYADKPVGRPKQHTGRPAAKKPRAAAKPATAKKAAAKKKAAPKKKKVVKKKAAVKKAKKVLTPEQLARKEKKLQSSKVAQLKADSLIKAEPKTGPSNAWLVYMSEQQKKFAQTKGHNITDFQQNLKNTAAAYQNLSSSEREHYNHVAEQNKAAAEAQKLKWIRSLEPAQIKAANNARAALTRRGVKGYQRKLEDERIPKTAKTAYIYFSIDRNNSGDLKGISFSERGGLIGAEWKALPADEKKVCRSAQRVASPFTILT